MMQDVKLLVSDVDGTLTDGTLIYDPSTGNVLKRFCTADGLGIVMAIAIGMRFAVVTGRSDNSALEWRMGELGVTDIITGCADKKTAITDLRAKYGLSVSEVAYIGDDINDLPAFDAVGVRIAVNDSNAAVLARADFVTTRPGGHGAVREAIDDILTRQKRMDLAIATYLERYNSANRQ